MLSNISNTNILRLYIVGTKIYKKIEPKLIDSIITEMVYINIKNKGDGI